MPLFPADVAVVVLNYNGCADTARCLAALYSLSMLPGRIIVVDNASAAGDRACVRESLERLRLADGGSAVRTREVFLPENNGYAAGNNAGIRKALEDSSCRAVWILNNDTEPESNALRELCNRLNACPKAGMAGSTLVYAHDRATVQCAGGYGFSGYTGATPALRGHESLSAVTALDPASVETRLGYISGASILVRREVLERTGLLAEEYFLYYEDAEFGLRAKKAGFALAWAPGSVVFHKEGGSTGAKSPGAGRTAARSGLVDYLALRNRIYLIRQYYPARLPVAVPSYAGVLLNRLRRGQIRRAPLVLRALLDGLRGKMGKPADLLPSGEERCEPWP